jgi:SAM-dependent methyltransferase
METNKYGRLKYSVPEIEAKELNWWQRNTLIEDKFCWVQPVQYQKFLRGDYLNYLKKRIKYDSKILELGCGTGWLLFLLLDSEFKNLYGIDFSSEQIQIANQRKNALSKSKQEMIRFEIGGFELLKAENTKFDVIICHGFLHHLSELEIKEVLKVISSYLTNDGLLLIWEPFVYNKGISDDFYTSVNNFRNLFRRGKRWGRMFSDEELKFRSLIDNRHEGKGSRGPSPKEIPFDKEELRELLESDYKILNEKKLMSFSHLIAQELLLTALTYPKIVRIIEWPILIIAKWLEKKMLSVGEIKSSFWIFELIECQKINKNV